MNGRTDRQNDRWMICRTVGRVLSIQESGQVSLRRRQWRRDLKEERASSGLLGRTLQAERAGASSGPEVGACLGIRGAARRQTEKARGGRGKGARRKQAAHGKPGLVLNRGVP